MYSNSSTPPTNDHGRRNDAQLAAFRRQRPDAWQRLLEAMSYEERVEAERRADAAELDSFIAEWDTRAEALAGVAAALTQPCPCCDPTPPRPTVTAMMIRDIWQDEGGPRRVAELLRQQPFEERNRLAVAYWNLLRQSGCHEVSLHEVGIQFELAMLRAA